MSNAIRTEFSYVYKDEPVIVKAACSDVNLDQADDLRFRFVDENGDTVKVDFDEAEFEELATVCTERLSEAKDEQMYDAMGMGYLY